MLNTNHVSDIQIILHAELRGEKEPFTVTHHGVHAVAGVCSIYVNGATHAVTVGLDLPHGVRGIQDTLVVTEHLTRAARIALRLQAVVLR